MGTSRLDSWHCLSSHFTSFCEERYSDALAEPPIPSDSHCQRSTRRPPLCHYFVLWSQRQLFGCLSFDQMTSCPHIVQNPSRRLHRAPSPPSRWEKNQVQEPRTCCLAGNANGYKSRRRSPSRHSVLKVFHRGAQQPATLSSEYHL